MIRVGIHGDRGFAPRWESYTKSQGWDLRNLDGYSSNVVNELKDCDLLLWHLDQDNPGSLNHAMNVLEVAEQLGLKVFPNHATRWHFDDKCAQKFLLDALDVPKAETWVFNEKKSALSFLKTADYPLVFKLKRGAGSLNVKLVENEAEAVRLVNRMFTLGLAPFPAGQRLGRAITRGKKGSKNLKNLYQRGVRVANRFVNQTVKVSRERDYVLFQQFLPENTSDLRVTIIGDRAFSFYRKVREDDFRASGSGQLVYIDPGETPEQPLKTAFDVSRTMGFQSMAYDFVYDHLNQEYLIIEMSYVYLASAVHDCSGFYDTALNWHQGQVWPEHAILDDLVGT